MEVLTHFWAAFVRSVLVSSGKVTDSLHLSLVTLMTSAEIVEKCTKSASNLPNVLVGTWKGSIPPGPCDLIIFSAPNLSLVLDSHSQKSRSNLDSLRAKNEFCYNSNKSIKSIFP